jgi:hypothetical protein
MAAMKAMRQRGWSMAMRATAVRAFAAWAAVCCFAPCLANAQAPRRDPQLDIQEMLIKNALTAVNHGNLTGNYTVLRDLGGPAFRERNSDARLATIFQKLREQKSDLSPILVLQPVYTEQPAIDRAGELNLVGYFPTQPLQIQFRLAFQHVGNGWMIDTVSIGTSPAQQQAPARSVGAAAQPGGTPYFANQAAAGYPR